MITSILIQLGCFLLFIVDLVLPQWNLTNNLLVSFSDVWIKIVSFDIYFPTVAMVQCLMIIISFNLFIFIGNLILGFISFFRGGGSAKIG